MAARDSARAEVCAALLVALLFFKQFYFLVCVPLGGMKRKLTVQKHFFLQPPPAQYGGRHTVTLIPGDGIGPELAHHVYQLFR